MSGLEGLTLALSITLGLMACVFILSRFLQNYGLIPLATAFTISGINYLLLYLLVLPGTVVHELSHYLTAVFTGVKVLEVKLFDPQKDGKLGWVKMAPTDPIRHFLIALAPLIGCSLAIYALVVYAMPASDVNLLTIAADDPVQGFTTALSGITAALRGTDYHRWTTWLVLYALFSLGFAVAPSNDDLAPLLSYTVVVLAMMLVVRAVDAHYGLNLAQSPFLNEAGAWLARGLQRLNALLLFVAALVALATVVVVPFALLARWLRSALGF